MKNPFLYAKEVSGGQYIPREDIEKRILSNISNKQNMAIIGERRLGKTSTAKYVVEVNKLPYIYVSFWGATTTEGAVELLVNSIKEYEENFCKSKKLLDAIKHLRPTIDLSPDGQMNISIASSKDRGVSIFLEIIKTIGLLSGKRKVVVIFDEFQELAKIAEGESLMALLRTEIQKNDRGVYIFVGSYKGEMSKIFTDPDRPFYKGAELISMMSIEEKDFFSYVKQGLAQKKIKISEDDFSYIYNALDGISGDIQQFFKHAFDLGEKDFKKDNVFQEIFRSELKMYDYIVNEAGYTRNQRAVLIGIAVHDNIGPHSADFVESTGVKNHNTITSAIKVLIKNKIIYKVNDKYHFSNPFFKIWLKSKFA